MSKHFVNHHVHSHWSIKDATNKPLGMARRIAELGQRGFFLTDHGVLTGFSEIQRAAKNAGIKAVPGVEFYVAIRGMNDKSGRDTAHLTVWAYNLEGYRNLCRLHTKSFMDGYYFDPRVDLDLLAEHSEGLMASSGCLGGMVPKALVAGDHTEAERRVKELSQVFDGRFWIEMQNHGIQEEADCRDDLLSFAKKYKLPIIASTDSHYTESKDWIAHDALICLRVGGKISDTNRKIMYVPEQFALQSEDDMLDKHDASHVYETGRVLDMCDDIDISSKVFHLPQYCESPEEQLKALVKQGLKDRYGITRPTKETGTVGARAHYELEAICKAGFANYLLIVWDLYAFARKEGIPCGAGRGSAAGSVVCYCIGITNIDPIKYDLMFERFIDPNRVSQPDIDADFSAIHRPRIIEYIKERWGNDRVSQIVAFQTLGGRAAPRDMARVLGYSTDLGDKIAKLIPQEGSVTRDREERRYISDALETVKELKSLYDSSAEAREVIDLAIEIEGTLKTPSLHAAGIVVADDNLGEYCPMISVDDKDGKGRVMATGYEMNELENIGLIKIDVLGIKYLDILYRAFELARKDGVINDDFVPDDIDVDDESIYRLLSAGKTAGVFQVEGNGLTKLMRDLKPDCYDDIATCISIFRPGPISQIGSLVARKNGTEEIEYPHPSLEPILKATYGLCLPHDTMVNTPSGYKKIEDIKCGDEILGRNDNAIYSGRVGGIWNTGAKGCLRITTSTGKIVESSEDHVFYSGNGDVRAIDLVSAIETGRYTHVRPNGILFQKWAKSAENKSLGCADLAYLLGYFVGNAYFGSTTISVCCGDSRRDAEVIKEIADKQFGTNSRLYFNTRAWYVGLTAKNGSGKRIGYRNPWKSWLSNLYKGDAWKSTAKGKRLPDCYLDLKHDERLALLRGLWDSDGTYAGGGPNFTSASPELLGQVSQLLETFKISYYVREKRVFVQDAKRFLEIVGNPILPDKAFRSDRFRTDMFVQTANLIFDSKKMPRKTRRGYRQAVVGKTFYKQSPQVEYSKQIDGFSEAYDLAYRQLWLGDFRPVYIDSVTAIGNRDCFDLQMEDKSNPYFFANDIVVHNCIYQEEIIKIGQVIAGFSLTRADQLRKVIAKKIVEKMPAEKADFVESAVKNGHDKKWATRLFTDLIEPAAKYAFGRSHAYSYADLTAKTAWIKSNLTKYFYAALLTSTEDHTEKAEKMRQYIADARDLGVAILPPNINTSGLTFTPSSSDSSIAFGLNGIKFVGNKAVQEIIKEREKRGPFTDLFSFVSRTKSTLVNSRCIESLVGCGALDCLPGNRESKLASLETAIAIADAEAEDRKREKSGMKPIKRRKAIPEKIMSERPPSPKAMLDLELDLIGTYLSGHPYDAMKGKSNATHTIQEARENGGDVSVCGIVTQVTEHTTKKAKAMMYFGVIEDDRANLKFTIFPRQAKEIGKLTLGSAVVLNGSIEGDEVETKLLVSSAKELHEAAQATTDDYVVRLTEDNYHEQIKEAKKKHEAGWITVKFILPDERIVSIAPNS